MTLARTVLMVGLPVALLHGSAHSQAASQPEVAFPVYRCPGPPVAYVDDISSSEAKRRGCRTIEGAEIVPTMPAPKPAQKPPAQKRLLDSYQRTAYDDCRTRAALAPTTLGVQTGLKICDEKFGQ